jgi:homoserine kinase type II
MAVFTALTRAEAASFLTQFSIGELTELQGIASGIENTNFFLTTTQARYVLTIFERLTFKQLPFYLELMQHLAAADSQSRRRRKIAVVHCSRRSRASRLPS